MLLREGKRQASEVRAGGQFIAQRQDARRANSRLVFHCASRFPFPTKKETLYGLHLLASGELPLRLSASHHHIVASPGRAFEELQHDVTTLDSEI